MIKTLRQTSTKLNKLRRDEKKQIPQGLLFLLLERHLCGVLIWGVILCLSLVSSVLAQTEIPIETIAREASGASLEAQVWVASVIITRAEERRLSYDEVCLQPYQFSCWNKGTKQKSRTQQELSTARKAWDIALKNPHMVNLYHDYSILPRWVNSSKVRFIKKIGRLLFYKEGR